MRARRRRRANTGRRVPLSGPKLVATLGIAAWVAFAAPAPVHAQGASGLDPRAEALNDSGKKLYLESRDYAAAAAKFRAAIAIRPDARYSYNLCAALEK